MKRAWCYSGAAALGTAAFALHTLYHYVLCRNQGWLVKLYDPKGHEAEYYASRDGAALRLGARAQERHSIVSARGEKLQGFYFPKGAGYSKKIAVIVHGYRSEHLETAGLYAEYYFSRGFDVFCPDNQAAGESGGSIIGYSHFESADLLLWLDYLEQHFGADIQLVLHGFSMGGATVLQVSDRVPKSVHFLVDDCGFSDAKQILKKSLGALYEPIRAINTLRSGYDLSHDTDVREHLMRARVPILFVHGKLDRTVPFSMGEELFERCPTEKDCLFVEGARHVESMFAAPELYAQKLDAFISRYIKE